MRLLGFFTFQSLFFCSISVLMSLSSYNRFSLTDFGRLFSTCPFCDKCDRTNEPTKKNSFSIYREKNEPDRDKRLLSLMTHILISPKLRSNGKNFWAREKNRRKKKTEKKPRGLTQRDYFFVTREKRKNYFTPRIEIQLIK